MITNTNEGAACHEHTTSHALEFFSKAGSLFTTKGSYYENESSALDLFKNVWYAGDRITALRLLFWLRDVRGGAGNRSGFRSILTWLCHDPEGEKWIEANFKQIPEYGRWDDLRLLFDFRFVDQVAKYWGHKILHNNILAAKWADRKDYPLRKALNMNEASFRKLLSSVRKNHIVETKMSANHWDKIEYPKVPSVAMSRYTRAFMNRDGERFDQFKQKLVLGEVTVNAGALFPYDCVRTALYGDKTIANAQFDALPNYMEDTNETIMVIADTSASMSCSVGGSSVTADYVSRSLAMYCSAKIPLWSPFHKKFMVFESENRLINWNGRSFSDVVNDHTVFDGAVGKTNIRLALITILDFAIMFGVSPKHMPTMLLIISDMQFSDGCDARVPVEYVMDKFTQAGYVAPKIVYWNTAGYAGSPGTAAQNVGLVSGFSPSILGAILDGDDLGPITIMNRTISKYSIVEP